MIPREWQALPMWTDPLEPLSEEAIELLCDADRRPSDITETILIRLR